MILSSSQTITPPMHPPFECPIHLPTTVTHISYTNIEFEYVLKHSNLPTLLLVTLLIELGFSPSIQSMIYCDNIILESHSIITLSRTNSELQSMCQTNWSMLLRNPFLIDIFKLLPFQY